MAYKIILDLQKNKKKLFITSSKNIRIFFDTLSMC